MILRHSDVTVKQGSPGVYELFTETDSAYKIKIKW